ncbi:MAG: adenylosuccinate synthetase [bacterium]|nr:adenylosuccinate synthetase [bacterium]
MNGYGKLLNGVQVLVVGGQQFGDEGKGKYADVFAQQADVIARCQGGANSGHTINANGKTLVTHLVPSGILYDQHGKINILGSGMAIDPRVLILELEALEKEGISFNHLIISLNAKLTLPQHIALDKIADELKKGDPAKGRIGTTGRGIGPTYTGHYARDGLRVNDMLNPDILKKRLALNLEDKIALLETYDPELVKKVMHHKDLSNGIYYDPKNIFNFDVIIEQYRGYGQRLKQFIRDTDAFVRKAKQDGKRLLLEGAQAYLLDIDMGTYPYVTSSNCSPSGIARGAGLDEKDIDLFLGVVKFPYMTRVGEGPFPTEFGGSKSAEWCGKDGITKEKEKLIYGEVSINDADGFNKGVAVRSAGNEYGATTGRPRRTGWLDLPLLRYAIEHNGPNVILTKIDVFDRCEEIKICVAYRYEGPHYNLGDIFLAHGTVLLTAVPEAEVLKYCQPIYESFPGWLCDTSQIRSFNNLPRLLKNIIGRVVKLSGMNPKIISVGADREQTIFV